MLIAVGAALGANARYVLSVWAAQRFGADFPYGTLIVNVSGSFLLGFLLSVTTERLPVSPEARLLLVVGFLGSYTTFSTYAFESMALFRSGGLWSGLVNVLGNNLVGLVCALLGAYLARLVG